jgi:hypothetical protein
MTSINRRSIRRLVLSTTVAALAVAVGPFASSAAAKYTTLVVPGQSIGGVKLSMNRDKVRNSKPLGLKKPTQHTAVSDSFTDKAGEQLIVLYKAGKKKQVLGVGTGLGTWHTANGLVNGASPAQAASLLPGCSFYGKSSAGRQPNPDPGDGQYCELILQPPLRYFYLSFNTGEPIAALASFSLSKVLIP